MTKQRCGTCKHWTAQDSAGVCAEALRLGTAAFKTSASSCQGEHYQPLEQAVTEPAPDSDEPPLPGVSIEDNLVQSRGDGDA